MCYYVVQALDTASWTWIREAWTNDSRASVTMFGSLPSLPVR